MSVATTNLPFKLDVLISILKGKYIGEATFFAVFDLIKHLGCPNRLQLFDVQVLPHAVNYCKAAIEAQLEELATLVASHDDEHVLTEARFRFGDTLELSGTGPRADVVL
ncbi:MAG: hypothetical protein K2W82_16835 [Candidatus Obscuribacterales bacterium]|nr:hypothetical protein [Candidatus Obscuribacterales bacterium]